MTKKLKFRDVSTGLKIFRDFLLGRKHVLHGRFPPQLAPRTIPPPDLPRGPDLKYSMNYYYKRNAMDSVKPPVIAPVAEGPPFGGNSKAAPGGIRPDSVCFNYAPTPGTPWWWDRHNYYVCTPDNPTPSSKSPCTVVPPCGFDTNQSGSECGDQVEKCNPQDSSLK